MATVCWQTLRHVKPPNDDLMAFVNNQLMRSVERLGSVSDSEDLIGGELLWCHTGVLIKERIEWMDWLHCRWRFRGGRRGFRRTCRRGRRNGSCGKSNEEGANHWQTILAQPRFKNVPNWKVTWPPHHGTLLPWRFQIILFCLVSQSCSLFCVFVFMFFFVVDALSFLTLQQFEEASYILASQSYYSLATVECFDQSQLCSQQNVTNYPTIRLYRPNTDHVVEYEGRIKTLSIVEAVNLWDLVRIVRNSIILCVSWHHWCCGVVGTW